MSCYKSLSHEQCVISKMNPFEFDCLKVISDELLMPIESSLCANYIDSSPCPLQRDSETNIIEDGISAVRILAGVLYFISIFSRTSLIVD